MVATLYDALIALEPEPDGLLWCIAANIDDSMLRDIAHGDYGRDVEAHFAALKRIRDGKQLPAPMPWEPKEVLELIRWSQPENPEWKPGRPGARGHWMRAFCCAALLRASGEPGNFDGFDGQNQTLIQLIWSLETLGVGFDREAAAFLSWLIGRRAANGAAQRFPAIDDEMAFYGLGLFWFGLRAKPPMSDPALIALAEWTAEVEEAGQRRHTIDYGLPPGRWLLDTTHFNICHAEWERLGPALLALDRKVRDPMTAEWIELFGTLLTPRA